jgi:hypothetical protein
MAGIMIPNEEIPDVTKAFAEFEKQNDMTAVMRELFDQSKLYMIADMSKDEIKLATRIFAIAHLKKLDSWKSVLRFYIRFLISKDRKSRKEILEAIKGYTPPMSPFRKMFGGGGMTQ